MNGYDERRFRTELYSVGGKERFSLFELTPNGVLITDFSAKGEVLDQLGSEDTDIYQQAQAHIAKFAPDKDIRFTKYDGSEIKAKCTECKTGTIRRELDFVDPKNIVALHPMPIFVCLACRNKFISVTDEYVSALAKRNPHLFDKSEIEEKNKDWDGFIKELRQYIISVFAAKRIRKLVFE